MTVSTIAGDYGGGIKLTCILDEGAPTVTASGSYFGQAGKTEKVLVWTTPLEENDWVAISNNAVCTYDRCGGIPCVERPVNAEVLVIGRIKSIPKLQRMPADTAAGDSLTKQLEGDYYRTAEVEIFGGITAIMKARIMTDGTNAIVPGVATYLELNIAGMIADHELAFDMDGTDAGVGVIPFHAVANAADGGEYSCLVGITGLIKAVTGV